MGNWNRHFVRVGSDGNVGIFSQSNDEFAYLDDTEKEFIITPYTTNAGYWGFNRKNTFLNRTINGVLESAMTFDNAGDFTFFAAANGIITLFNNNGIEFTNRLRNYYGVSVALNGINMLSGYPDLRTGVTAADASPITIYSSTSSGSIYEIKARILATSGSSATYTISWTEGGVAQTVALTVTAVDTEVHDNFVIAPDANTNITAQITSLTSSTVNVDAIVSVLG